MKRIFYLAYFDVPENAAQNRNYVLSATTKSSYICEAIANLGYDVTIVSASATKSDKFCKGMDVELCKNLHLHLFDSLPSGNVIKRIKSRIYLKHQLKRYLIENVTDNDVLVVYHSLAYSDIISSVKKRKNFKLVIETNEIYSDVTGNEKTRKKEIQFLKSADAFILSTELLNLKINVKNKPFIINYGTYQIAEKYSNNNWGDDKIHCVYCGTLDPRKGCLTAVETANFLDDNYRIHIIGFGSEKDKQILDDKIKSINETASCKVSYDGLFSGDEYIKFIQRCQIGFSTQSPDAQFNETSFPSKVLSYLANGLRVVSIKIKAIEKSKISDLLYFYEDNTPRAILEAIKSIDFNDNYDSRKRILELDKMFAKELKKIMEDEL